jgi:protein-disulfide isomerase-like protein with CxxC motif
MDAPIDPTIRPGAPPRVSALQAPDLCGWCLGAGKYLEALDCEVGHAYLPIVCQGCNGKGRSASAA